MPPADDAAPLATAEELEVIFPWMRVSDYADALTTAAPAQQQQQPAPPPLPPPPPPCEPLTPFAAPQRAVAADDEERLLQPLCVICMDASPCVVLLPCKHLPLCNGAACAAMMGVPPKCPICRALVADTLSVFPAWA
jgi:hypothetical protein